MDSRQISTSLWNAIQTIILQLCTMIRSERLSACYEVKKYLLHTTEQHIIRDITGALSANVATLIEDYLNLTDLDLKSLHEDALVSNQGVYAAIVRSAPDRFFTYVGSSYGRQGLKYRIVKNHLNPCYRTKNPSKALYVAMSEPGAVTSFVRLVIFEKEVAVGQVLLAEATCACLLGTYDAQEYREMRSQYLPYVDWERGLNRSDPVKLTRTGSKSIGNDVTTYRRLRRLHNCLNGGPMRVSFCSRRGHIINGSYRFALFRQMFTIPKDIALQWNLDITSEVNVEWHCSDGRHPHAFAPMAKESDDGKRVALRAFANVEGIVHEHWIVRKTPEAVPLSNTIHDFLNNMIVGKQYKWTESRRYIFQDTVRGQNDDLKGAGKHKNEPPLRMSFRDDHFKWDDGKRLPETKPAKEVDAEGESLPVSQYENMMEGDDEVTEDDEDYLTILHRKYLYPYHSELNRRGFNVCSSRMCSGQEL